MLRIKPFAIKNSNNLQKKIPRIHLSTSVKPIVGRRRIPESLLLQQEARLRRDGKDNLSPNNRASKDLMASALDDIFIIFKPNAITEEDEEVSLKLQEDKINNFIRSNDFGVLLREKFKLNTKSNLLQPDALINNLPKLNLREYQAMENVTQTSIISNPKDNWNSMPMYLKQLQYYMAFGSYGPREGIPFFDFKKQDVSKQHEPYFDNISKLTVYLFIIMSFIAIGKRKLHERETEIQ